MIGLTSPLLFLKRRCPSKLRRSQAPPQSRGARRGQAAGRRRGARLVPGSRAIMLLEIRSEQPTRRSLAKTFAQPADLQVQQESLVHSLADLPRPMGRHQVLSEIRKAGSNSLTQGSLRYSGTPWRDANQRNPQRHSHAASAYPQKTPRQSVSNGGRMAATGSGDAGADHCMGGPSGRSRTSNKKMFQSSPIIFSRGSGLRVAAVAMVKRYPAAAAPP
jgi:hypothetical protein